MLAHGPGPDPGTRPAPSTPRCTARCCAPDTRPSASSTTSGSPRRARPPTRRGEAGIELVLLLAAYARGGLERFRQESPADYLEQVEALRATGAHVGVAPHSVRACPRDWLEEIGRYADRGGARPARPRRRAAARDRGVPGRARRCARSSCSRETGCLGPRTTVVHATHANERGARPARRGGRARLRLPDDRGQPRRRLLPGRGDLRPRDRALHRLRLERAHRPARGAARARGDRPPPHRAPQRRPAGDAASARRRRGPPRARRSSAGTTSRSTSGTRRCARRRPGRRRGGARLRLRRRTSSSRERARARPCRHRRRRSGYGGPGARGATWPGVRPGRPPPGLGHGEPDRPARRDLPRADRGRRRANGGTDRSGPLGEEREGGTAARLGRPHERPGRDSRPARPHGERGLAGDSGWRGPPLAKRRARAGGRGACPPLLHRMARQDTIPRPRARSEVRDQNDSSSRATPTGSQPGSATTPCRSSCAKARRESPGSSSRARTARSTSAPP